MLHEADSWVFLRLELVSLANS
eukprot:SAG31_NODE_13913_length_838_cov_0.876861_1_plen_21_part_10